MGQSFKAQDASVQAGFYFSNFNGAIQHQLYSGEGVGGSLLATRSLTAATGPNVWFHTIGTQEQIDAGGAGLLDRYADGRFLLVGSNVNLANGIFTGLDASIYVAPASPVPLPASAWLLLSGLLGIAVLSRSNGAMAFRGTGSVRGLSIRRQIG